MMDKLFIVPLVMCVRANNYGEVWDVIDTIREPSLNASVRLDRKLCYAVSDDPGVGVDSALDWCSTDGGDIAILKEESLSLAMRLAEQHYESLRAYVSSAMNEGDWDCVERSVPQLKKAKTLYDKLLASKGLLPEEG